MNLRCSSSALGESCNTHTTSGDGQSQSHHHCRKSEDSPIIFQHLDEVFLGRLGDEGETRLLAVLQTAKPVVGREGLGWRCQLRHTERGRG